MEILGLAIVVILILLGATFFITTSIKKPVAYRTSFISSELASNMINTYLKTVAADCSQLTMTELLQDCAKGASIQCANSQDSCAYAKSTAQTIFENTLNKWNYTYYFSAYTDERNAMIRIGNPCLGEKKSKIFPVPSSVSTIYVKLEICG